MPDSPDSYEARRAAFRKLHESGLFILPNPWDVGSAKYLASLGFAALATTSSGFAFSQGRPDGGMSLDEMIAHIRRLVAATPLPVNADFEDGHASDLEALSENVRRCVEAGVAGLSLEDATGDPKQPLYPFDVAVDRMRAARRAIADTGADVTLVGRAECFLTGHESSSAEAIRRLTAYAGAGADCLYAPGVVKVEDIAEIVRAVAPKPVNVLLRPAPFPSIAELEQLGVRRVSVGGALALAAWDGLSRAASRLRSGEAPAASALTNRELNDLFGRET